MCNAKAKWKLRFCEIRVVAGILLSKCSPFRIYIRIVRQNLDKECELSTAKSRSLDYLLRSDSLSTANTTSTAFSLQSSRDLEEKLVLL